MIKLNNISEELAKVSVTEMEHSGYKAAIKEARKLVDNGRENSLPMGNSIPIIPIQCLPACPDSWVRETGSYVVPVDADVGLWFDWTMNDRNTAVIPSVKGMNPITGQKIDELRLEQYRDKCPVHDIDLGHGRYCEKCGYKLAPQNYVSYPNTLWWDGFRQDDGSVRQFFFTEDEKRDIASLVIGKENTVPAFGFAFYKTIKERFVESSNSRGMNLSDVVIGSSVSWQVTSDHMNYSCDDINMTGTLDFDGNNSTLTTSSAFMSQTKSLDASNSAGMMRSVKRKVKSALPRQTKEVSVGAGAKILQNLDVDRIAVEEYIEEPQALIRLYFVFEEQLTGIVKKGGVKVMESNGGFLNGLPVG